MGEVKTAHTPGPWDDDNNDGFSIWNIWAGTQIVAKVIGDSAETNANARLIAAAPCLLGALRGVMPAVEAYLMTGDAGASRLKRRVFRREIDAARAAIAKATGSDQ
jgi:hypothetical protein